MRTAAVTARFKAVDILALIDVAFDSKLDELWFVRGTTCLMQTPDSRLIMKPIAIDGDRNLLVDVGTYPRVEVLELHNHVLKTLRTTGTTDPEEYVELRITEDDDYCLVLCFGVRAPVAVKNYSWMRSFCNVRRLF